MHAHGAGANEVARRKDPDQAAILCDRRCRRAALKQALGRFTQSVLGRDNDRIRRHELIDCLSIVRLLEAQSAGPQPLERLAVELNFEGNRSGWRIASSRRLLGTDL
jgi:hypothetical protein